MARLIRRISGCASNFSSVPNNTHELFSTWLPRFGKQNKRLISGQWFLFEWKGSLILRSFCHDSYCWLLVEFPVNYARRPHKTSRAKLGGKLFKRGGFLECFSLLMGEKEKKMKDCWSLCLATSVVSQVSLCYCFRWWCYEKLPFIHCCMPFSMAM